jgi:hypothetical protein
MESSNVLESDINSESVGKCTPKSLKKPSTPLSTMSSITSTPAHSSWEPISTDFKSSLIQRETAYEIEWDFSKQHVITGKMRAVLFDWMMEVSSEFVLKRDTFHNACSFADRLLT